MISFYVRGDLSEPSLGGMERYEDTSDLLASVAASYSYSRYLLSSWSSFLFDARYGFHSSATRLNDCFQRGCEPVGERSSSVVP